MPKFYVESGDLRRVQDANNPTEAVIAALTRETEEREDLSLGVLVGVNEVGFGYNPCADCEEETPEEIQETGFCDDCPHKSAVDECFIFETGTAIKMAGLSDVFRVKNKDGDWADLEESETEDES